MKINIKYIYNKILNIILSTFEKSTNNNISMFILFKIKKQKHFLNVWKNKHLNYISNIKTFMKMLLESEFKSRI